MNKEIAEINPKKAELITLASKFGKLTIKGIDDTVGYNAVQSARKELQVARSTVIEQGKKLREEAIATQKAIIVLVDDLVDIIAPEEKRLKEIKDKIDHDKEIERRKKSLPERIEKLKEIDFTQISEESLLEMSDTDFTEFFNRCHAIYLKKREAEAELKSKRETAKLEAEKAELEAEKTKLADEKAKIAQDKEDNIQRKKNEAEKKKQEERWQAEEKKKRDEAVKQAEKETEERIAREAQEKKATEVKVQAELEKKKKYKDFMEKNEAVDSDVVNLIDEIGNAVEADFVRMKSSDKITLFKRVDSIKL